MKENSVIPSEATSISSEMNGDALEWGHGPQTDRYCTACVGGSDRYEAVCPHEVTA